MLLLLLVTVPVFVGAIALVCKPIRWSLSLLVAAAVSHAAGTVALWTQIPARQFGWAFTLDGTGLIFLSTTSLLFLVACLYTIPYLLDDTHEARMAPHRFVPCLLWFLAAMTLVATTQHLALQWAAVEATTLASAPLVYFHKRKAALEATWKYLLICSVGIALALLGVFFLGIAAGTATGVASGLELRRLIEVAPQLSTTAKPWLKAAFVLALVGYGTKMGLAPLHTWLPDTHSQAPSPVSALLSGALLNCALLAILRVYQVCLASGDGAFASHLLVLLGFVSLVVACAFMLGQRDYKRLFAYSSIENMGIVAIGVGLGGAAVYGAMLHAINHSLCKAGLFLLAGNVLRRFGTTEVRAVRGVLRQLPVTGILLILLLFAMGGTPPFGAFVSELVILRHAVASGHTWLGVLFVSLLVIAFLSMAGVLLPMIHGEGQAPTREARLTVVAPLTMVIGTLALGMYIPPALSDLLARAARMLGG